MMYICMAQDTCEHKDQDQGQDQYVPFKKSQIGIFKAVVRQV